MGKWLLRIEDLPKLDHMAYVLNLIGVPMLLLSLILGIIWSYVSLETLYWADPKVLGSIVLLFYTDTIYLSGLSKSCREGSRPCGIPRLFLFF